MKTIKSMMIVVMLLSLVAGAALCLKSTSVFAAGNQTAQEESVTPQEVKQIVESDGTDGKAIAAGIAIGLAALSGAISMGWSISKSNDSIARQPEAADNIRSLLMIGLVFIETVVIYALIVAILIVFVL